MSVGEIMKEKVGRLRQLLNENGSVVFYLLNSRYEIVYNGSNVLIMQFGSNLKHSYSNLNSLLIGYKIYGESLIELLQYLIIIE